LSQRPFAPAVRLDDIAEERIRPVRPGGRPTRRAGRRLGEALSFYLLLAEPGPAAQFLS